MPILTLNGWLTYLAGWAMIALGITDLLGVYDVAGQTGEQLITEGLAIVGFRRALGKVGV